MAHHHIVSPVNLIIMKKTFVSSCNLVST